jgi:DNA-binding response OmpR family regulator
MTKILVVDDEHDILFALEMLLNEEEYQVITAINGRHALERLAEGRPDLVIIDVMMPILSGPETILKMKADAEYATIPIILMSGVKPAFTKKDYPFDLFLQKPFEIDHVLKTIKNVLARKKPEP